MEQSLNGYRAELAAAGVSPAETSEEEEAELQRLVLEAWRRELLAVLWIVNHGGAGRVLS